MKRFALLLAIAFFSLSGTTRAGLDLDPLKSVRDSLDDAKQAVSEIEKSAFRDFNNEAITITRQIDTLLNNIDKLLANRLDESLGKLNESEQAVFRNISRSIDQANEVAKGNLDHVDQIQKGLRITAESIVPWSDKTPVLLDYVPKHVIPPANSDDMIDLTILGWRLSNGPPKLLLDGRSIGRLASNGHEQLTFSVPRKIFATTGRDFGRTNLVLRTYEDRRFWFDHAVDFELVYYTVPERLASYRLDVRRTEKTTDEAATICKLLKPRHAAPGDTDPPADDRKNDRCCEPRRGWSFKPDSAQLRTSSSAQYIRTPPAMFPHSDPANFNRSNARITTNARNKVCLFAMAWSSYVFVTADMDAWVEIKEEREYPVNIWTENFATGEIGWHRDIPPIQLPTDADAFKFIVTFYDGSQRAFTGPDFTDKLLRVDYDPAGKILTAQPKSPQ